MFALFYKRSDVVDLRMKACYKLIPWFWWGWSSIPKVPKIASFQCLYDISKKKLEMKLIFGMQINVKVFYKLISTLLASNFSIGWYYHYWWAWSSILKVRKVTSLQYLYNILKTGFDLTGRDRDSRRGFEFSRRNSLLSFVVFTTR